MAEIIKDGTGTGKTLKINENNKAMCDSVIQSEESEVAERTGQSFVISTLVKTLNSTDPHFFLYLKNTSVDKNLYIWIANFGWNGGSTNHNRVLKWGWLVNSNEPTANHTAVIPGNLNFTSSEVASAIAYKWDGVGDGMTYTGGGIASEAIFAQGYPRIETRGIPILGVNHSFGILLTGEEVGDAVVTLRFYYK